MLIGNKAVAALTFAGTAGIAWLLALAYFNALEDDHLIELGKARNKAREACETTISISEESRHVLQTEKDRGDAANRDLSRRLRQAALPKSAPGTSGYLHTPTGCSSEQNGQRNDGRICVLVDPEKFIQGTQYFDQVRAEAIAWRAWYPKVKEALLNAQADDK